MGIPENPLPFEVDALTEVLLLASADGGSSGFLLIGADPLVLVVPEVLLL
jgi:hypothetical protein